ncbi:MAG: tRNA lysidine(34) synthetase TilS [Treponema sp.]|jgi:tRNA(Ile)-lysidine synthase|nr:tRNA lysidine(34) synthetase TilS [Treponema sp.]
MVLNGVYPNPFYPSQNREPRTETGGASRIAAFEAVVGLALGETPKGTRFLAAVSGGADSTAMLAALTGIRREKGFTLRCFHVEHGIRPAEESRGDAAAVRELCKKLEVPCRVVHIPPGVISGAAASRRIGLEAAARLFRHAAWNREAARIGAERILVAHTGDDLLETALMRFLRGAGPAGLAAMPRVRGRILRPLLKLSRSQVLAYLEDRGIPFRTDSTNADSAFLRNRIRNRLIPVLDELFPGWRPSVANLGETQRLTAEFLTAEAERRIPWEAVPGTEDADPSRRSYRVSRRLFFSQPEILREEGLFLAADKIGGGQPRRGSIRRFTRDGRRALDLGAMRLEAAGDWVIAAPRIKAYGEEGFSLLIKEPGSYKLKGYPLTLRCLPEKEGPLSPENSFCAGLPLVLRPSRPEDRMGGVQGVSRRKALDRTRGSEYTGSITAEDFRGIAAFIGTSRDGAAVIADRNGNGSGRGEGLFSFVVNEEPQTYKLPDIQAGP